MSKVVKSTRPTRVHVVGNVTNGLQIRRMFTDEGFVIVKEDEQFDVACFTGGEDVTPFLYGERPLMIDGVKRTHFNPDRDLDEVSFYHKIPAAIPKVGICRGGQLLNVLNGGRMYQHVTDHTSNHDMTYIDDYIKDKKGGNKPVLKTVNVTSTHHQMMIPQDYGEILGWASVATSKYTQEKHFTIDPKQCKDDDVEVVYYWQSNSLCFQPHPEYTGRNSPLRNVFFKLMDVHLKTSALTSIYE